MFRSRNCLVTACFFATTLSAASAHADPTRLWSTYYGGGGSEVSYDVTFDADGDILSVGTTTTPSPAGTSSAMVGSLSGNVTHDATLGGTGDGFVAKFNNAGVRQWGTYYGGVGYEQIFSVATDSGDNVIATGYTGSANTGNVIATVGDMTFNGSTDGMLVKFTTTGARSWGTYIGGNSGDYGFGVCVASTGTIYVVGGTTSTDLDVNAAHQTARAGSYDAFLAKVTSAGTVLWITYYGGADGTTAARDCVVDANNNIYLTGYTSASVGIAHNGPDAVQDGVYDAFLAKFTTSGVLSKATYYGGADNDYGYAIDLDSSNNIYLAGYTNSENTANVMDTTGAVLQDDEDAFVVKFNSSFVRQWGRYYGGSSTNATNVDRFYDLEVTGNGVMLSGETDAFDLIATPDGFGPTFVGSLEGTFVALDASDGDAFYGTYISSSDDASPDLARGIAANFDQVAVGGESYGAGIATAGAYDTTLEGLSDTFLTLIRMFTI